MKRMAALFVAALVAAPISAEEKKSDFDPTKLEGKWKIVSGEKFGEKVEGKSLEGTVTIAKDTITIKGDETHMMKFKLDAKAAPVAITMTGVEGPAKDLVAEGIIEVKGDELKLCYGFPGEKRPTAFAVKKGEKALSFVLKREK